MFHLFKQTRAYNGDPYWGPTSDYKLASYKTLEAAKIAKLLFQERSPVGWNIFNGETGELVSEVPLVGTTAPCQECEKLKAELERDKLTEELRLSKLNAGNWHKQFMAAMKERDGLIRALAADMEAGKC